MGLPELKHPGYTLEDWKSWDGHWELINGMAYPTYGMTPAPSLEHQRVVTRMTALFYNAVEAAKRKFCDGNCEVFTAPVDVFLGEGVYQPDLVVVCDPAKKSPRGIEGPPDLVVEVLSPGTASKDTVRKRWAYEAAGVPEYLIVDPEEKVAVILQLDEHNRYQEAARVEWGMVMAILGGKISVLLGEES